MFWIAADLFNIVQIPIDLLEEGCPKRRATEGAEVRRDVFKADTPRAASAIAAFFLQHGDCDLLKTNAGNQKYVSANARREPRLLCRVDGRPAHNKRPLGMLGSC